MHLPKVLRKPEVLQKLQQRREKKLAPQPGFDTLPFQFYFSDLSPDTLEYLVED